MMLLCFWGDVWYVIFLDHVTLYIYVHAYDGIMIQNIGIGFNKTNIYI